MADLMNILEPFFASSMAEWPTNVPDVTREYPRGLSGYSVADQRMAFGLLELGGIQ